jgi:hypothetical protein
LGTSPLSKLGSFIVAIAGWSEGAGADGAADAVGAVVAGGDGGGAVTVGAAVAVVGGGADETAGEDREAEGAAAEGATATCGGAFTQATQRTPIENSDGTAMPAMRRAP